MPTETTCIIRNVRRQLTDIIFRNFARIYRHYNNGYYPRANVVEDMTFDADSLSERLRLRREVNDPYDKNHDSPPIVVSRIIRRFVFNVSNEVEVSFNVVHVPDCADMDGSAVHEFVEKEKDLSLDELTMIAQAFEKEYPTE